MVVARKNTKNGSALKDKMTENQKEGNEGGKEGGTDGGKVCTFIYKIDILEKLNYFVLKLSVVLLLIHRWLPAYIIPFILGPPGSNNNNNNKTPALSLINIKTNKLVQYTQFLNDFMQ